MRIAKAKRKDDQLSVEMEDTDGATERKTSLKSLDGYHPDLDAAFDALAPSVREILEWPNSLYGNCMRVTGVSWSTSEKTGVEGAVISAQASLEDCNSPFCFNTPFLPFELYNEENEGQPVMPDGAQDGLRALRAEVEAYIGGKRAQGDLFGRDVGTDEERAFIAKHEALVTQTTEVVNAIIEKAMGPLA